MIQLQPIREQENNGKAFEGASMEPTIMHQNEVLRATCDCYLLPEDHQLFLITFKTDSINEAIFGKIT